MNVLVVDDCEMTRTVMEKICEQVLDAAVATSINENEAWLLFQNLEFDLVITDLIMDSDIGGQILCEKIKEISSCPVVLMTGNVKRVPMPEMFAEVIDKRYIITHKEFLLKYKTNKIVGATK